MERFAPIEPYASALLDVGDGHRVYWECCGNPQGEAALFLHGGPGAGAHAGARRLFDPARFRIVLVDQRGCGRSTPLASADGADLSTNTTPHLIADLEALRAHLAIDRWSVVLGMSWGTTLALAYAHAHRMRIHRLVLTLFATTSPSYVAWITEGVGMIFPREWERFRDAVPERHRSARLVDAYAAWLFDPDPLERDRAAREWCAWEDAHVSLTPGHTPFAKFEDPTFRLGFARLVTHYWRHAAFLDDALLRDAAALDGMPGEIIHGRYDVSAPLSAAWDVAKRWKTSHLTVLEDAGHGGGDTFVDAVLRAVNS